MDGSHCRSLLCLLWSLLFNSLTNSILSSSFITLLSSRNDPAGEQPMTDPGELKLQLNIEKRVTAWHSSWIRGGTSISHQSKFSVLIKKKNRPVCVCERMCGYVHLRPRAPIVQSIGHIAHFKSPHQLQSLLWVDTPITLVKETHAHVWNAHYLGQGGANTLHTWSLTHPHFVGNTHTYYTHTHNSASSQCWRVWSIGNPWWRRP